MSTRPAMQTELGQELRCTKCLQFWPADKDFFFAGKGKVGLTSWCKVCYREDPKIIAKAKRWADGNRKGVMKVKPGGYVFAPLASALAQVSA